MTFLSNVLSIIHDLPFYAMIIFVNIFYVMICYGNQFNNLPLPPCTFTLITVYEINCCTFLFNMSYSHIALKIFIQLPLFNVMKNYIAPIIKKKSKSLILITWWLFLSG